jgi:pimeloyl-ACP methyl ester carboxylesterase
MPREPLTRVQGANGVLLDVREPDPGRPDAPSGVPSGPQDGAQPGSRSRAVYQKPEKPTAAYEEVLAPDGRRLIVSEWGKRSGQPVFIMHGTPGSRIGVAPRSSVLYRMGVRLISYDRPGYGRSDRDAGHQVVAAADDVLAIAKYLGISRFAVVGRSGGGPHALACAARLPDMVTKVAALVSLAPRVGVDGMGDEAWFRDMTQSNIDEYTRARQGIGALEPALRLRAETIRNDPSALISQLREEIHASDRRVIEDAGIRQMLKSNYHEALLGRGDGWIDDAMAFIGDWGFELSEIQVPVLLWHGKEDVFAPVNHSRWLAERIAGSELRIEDGKAHFDALSELPDLLPWLRQL